MNSTEIIIIYTIRESKNEFFFEWFLLSSVVLTLFRNLTQTNFESNFISGFCIWHYCDFYFFCMYQLSSFSYKMFQFVPISVSPVATRDYLWLQETEMPLHNFLPFKIVIVLRIKVLSEKRATNEIEVYIIFLDLLIIVDILRWL